MATVVSKEEADAHIDDLYARALGGEEIVIEQSGEPKLRLVPVPVQEESKPPVRRVFGSMRGQFTVPDSFFDPMTEEELKEWGY